MALTVHIRNFQSIREAILKIDGFTVITGTNNSGKTACIRAIRGVFTNPPAGPLVRHGAAYLSVEITFPDGQTVLWEKGWEKPNQKGATINRYTLNGKQLSSVGRGVPDEVAALGVESIQAGTEKLWPQVADQFKGTLFLIGATGSTVAEAVADVDRVGRLSDALKFAEKDRRAITRVLKVRRNDEVTLVGELEAFNGLDEATTQIDKLAQVEKDIQTTKTEAEEVSDLRDRVADSRNLVGTLEGVANIAIPAPTVALEAPKARQEAKALAELKARLTGRQEAVKTLEAVADVPTVPDGKKAQELGKSLAVLHSLFDKRSKSQKAVSKREPVAGVEIPSAPDGVGKIQGALSFFSDLRSRRASLVEKIQKLEASVAEKTTDLEAVVEEVHEVLGGVGMCPTCRRPMEA